MEEDGVAPLPRPGTSVEADPLPAVLRGGAGRALTQAIGAEVPRSRCRGRGVPRRPRRVRRRAGPPARVVRNGHAPERRLQTGIGPIEVRRPRVRVRDRGDAGSGPIAFTAAILPPYPRRTRNIEELVPWLYLKGITTGRFEEALAALLGPEAPGLSATTLRRLKERLGPGSTSAGSTSGARTRSGAPPRPCGCGPPGPRAACRAGRRRRWSSSSPNRPSATGAGSTAPSGSERLGPLIEGVRLRDGEPVQATEDQAAA